MFSSEMTFNLKRQLLAKRLLSTAREFGRDHGLPRLEETALHQCQSSSTTLPVNC